jgi:hypothetical protein
MHKLVTFIIALFIFFSLISCYKDESLTPQQSFAWLVNKKWKIEYYKVESVEYTAYKDYILQFEGDLDVLANTKITIKEGRWAVFSGVNGNILQIIYPESYKDVWQLSGNWVIADQQMNTLLLKQSNIEMMLTVVQ